MYTHIPCNLQSETWGLYLLKSGYSRMTIYGGLGPERRTQSRFSSDSSRCSTPTLPVREADRQRRTLNISIGGSLRLTYLCVTIYPAVRLCDEKQGWKRKTSALFNLVCFHLLSKTISDLIIFISKLEPPGVTFEKAQNLSGT